MNSQTDLTLQLQRLADAEGANVSTAVFETAIITPSPATEPSVHALVPGQWLGHYRIDARIGQGGGGTVYRAHDSALERTVAIKRIHQQLCTPDWDHLKREATALMRLQHPNIATFHDLEERDNGAWLAMEYVDGIPLSEHLHQHQLLNTAEFLKLAEGVLCALGHAHAAGVIHADIKPENIMLTAQGRVKVLDFGIARLVHDMALPDDQQFTRHDTISGSPGFMSPEQLRADKLDARSDLFAVAAVLFQSATGEPAFGGNSAADRIHAIFSHQRGDISRRLPGSLGRLLDSALDPDPAKRPASAAEMLHQLRQLASGQDQPEASRSLLLLPAEASGEATDLAWLGRALNNVLRPMLEQTGRFELVPDARATELRGTEDSAIALAQKLAEQALTIDTDAHSARQWLVYILMRQHRPDEAMHEAEIVMQRSSDPHMACYFAACCLAAEARYEDALRYYQTSLRFNTSRSWTWFGAGNCHARLNRYESARWCLQRAIEAETSSSHFTSAGCGTYLAELMRHEGQLEQAWEVAKLALKRVENSDFIYRDSFRTLVLITLGRIAMNRNQCQTATAAFHQAELGIRGRPRALGAGHLLTQALAGKAAASNNPALLDLAKATLRDKSNWNFDWLWGCHRHDSQSAIDEASQTMKKSGHE